MSGRYLLDTSILIALLADETAVKEKLARADEVFIPGILIGELYYGAGSPIGPRRILPALMRWRKIASY